MNLPYVKQRRPLLGLKQALDSGTVTFGFIGGSITDARPGHNWPQFFMSSFIERYSDVRCRVENAAIGATGSDLAVFRAQRDLINRQCHIVFIEFAVNDEGVETTRRRRTREGLIRQLLKTGIEDIVIVYTFSQSMKERMEQGQYPETIADFELLAEHYGLTSIWVGKYGLDQVNHNRLSMEEWLPDGLHPMHQGSKIYAELVFETISNEIDRVKDLPINKLDIPAPLDELCWEKTSQLPLNQIELEGKWQEYRWHAYEWIDTVLETSESDAKLSFTFTGRGAVLVFDYGYESLEFQYRIDGKQWQQSNRECPDWVGPDGWCRLFELDCSLDYAEHMVEIEVLAAENASEHRHFRIGRVGILL